MSTLDHATIDRLARTANAAADAAGPRTLRFFRRSRLADDKDAGAGFDPVTEGDRSAEQAMRDLIAQMRPRDSILGEEFGTSEGDSGLTWVLDPIDGTRAYLAGAPTWGTLIAVNGGEGPILGLIDQPHTQERFFGGPGGAVLSRMGGRRTLSTAQTADLGQAIVLTTFPEVGTREEGAAFAEVSRQARLTRYGLDCYAYALVAMGQADLVIEAGLEAYDIQGPMAVVEAAGGVVTDWRGGPAHRGGRVIAAANRHVHDQALKVLSAVP